MTPHQTIGQVIGCSHSTRTKNDYYYMVWEPTSIPKINIYSESELSPTTNEIPKPYSFE